MPHPHSPDRRADESETKGTEPLTLVPKAEPEATTDAIQHIDGIIDESDATPDDTKSEKPVATEQHIEKIDGAFDELIDAVKHSPEAKKAALEILIGQMRQIAEQMKQVRDMKHLHELKKSMLKHWKEIEQLAGGDPALVQTIHDWGKNFVEEKIVYYDMINEVKDEMVDKAQDAQLTWNSMQISLGKLIGWTGSEFEMKRVLENIHSNESMSYDEEKRLGYDDWKQRVRAPKGSGIEKFFADVQRMQRGFDETELDLRSAQQFFSNVTNAIRLLTAKLHGTPGMMEKHPEASAVLAELVEQANVLSSQIKDISRAFKMTKKIRDTQLLPTYAASPDMPQAA